MKTMYIIIIFISIHLMLKMMNFGSSFNITYFTFPSYFFGIKMASSLLEKTSTATV